MWSRRRDAVRAEETALRKAEEARKVALEHARLEEKSDDEILQDLGLPDPDQMTKGDDFSVFMKSAVPERLRRRALRQLWRSNPVLANVDNLVDYGEDFANEGKIVGVLKTAYQVGKGFAARIPEPEADDAAPGEVTVVSAGPDELPMADEADAEPLPVDPVEEPDTAPAPQDDQEFAQLPRRRMRFEFAG